MIRSKGYDCLIITIKTPHCNGMACYNRKFNFNILRMVRVLLVLESMDTLTTVSSTSSVAGQFKIALTPTTTHQACFA